MQATLTQRISAKEFRSQYFPEEENAQLYELMEGEIIRRGAPAVLHQRISKKLFLTIHSFIESKQLGEVFYSPIDVVLDEYNVFQPDLVFVSNERKNIVTTNFINGCPDLIIEIISPSSVMRDRIYKKQVCERVGVKEYWLVSPEYLEIEVFNLSEGKYQLYSAATADEGMLQSIVLKDIILDLKALFAS